MTDPQRARRTLVLEALFVAFGLAYVFVCSFRPNWDIDIFWHIKAGEWISDHVAIPHVDLFSANDPGRPWTTFQWLYEVLVYQLNARAGFASIRLLHAGLFVFAFAAFYRCFRALGLGRVVAGFLWMALLALSDDRLRVRPDAFNFAFTALVLPLLLDVTGRRIGARALAGVAVVAGLWANVHAGGALWLVLATGAIAAGRMLRLAADPREPALRAAARDAVLLFLTSTLPMLPMPGFLQGSVTAIAMLDESAVLIPEWQPPLFYFLRSFAGALTPHNLICGALPYVLLVGAGAAIATGVARGGWRDFVRRRDPGTLVLVMLLAAMAAQSSRFVWLDGLALAGLAFAWRDRIATVPASVGMRLAILVLGAGAFAVSWQSSIIQQRGGLSKAVHMLTADLEPGLFPKRASDVVAAMGLHGRIFNQSSWGGYLIYRHFPECRVFADGRGNFTAEERETLEALHDPFKRETMLEPAWDRWHFDILFLKPHVFPLRTWDRTRWVRAWRDDHAEVFVRRSPDNEDNVQRVVDWWRRQGVDVPGGLDAFEEHVDRVMAYLFLGRPEVRDKIALSRERAESFDPARALSGRYDLSMALFEAGLYDEAADGFRWILGSGIRHGSTALYLAWAEYLGGHVDAARSTLETSLVGPDPEHRPDRGPVRGTARRVLALLAARLGLNLDVRAVLDSTAP